MQLETIEEIEYETELKMDSSIESLKKEFNSMHAGRISPALLDSIRVDYYGVPTPISQVATISTPEPQMLAINPWEKKMIKEVERSILKANMGFSVSNDGNIIRIVMPPFTEERRKEIIKQVKKKGEECKIAIRNIRREANDNLKKLEKDKSISQDDGKKSLDSVQKLTDKHIDTVDNLVSQKEKDILTI